MSDLDRTQQFFRKRSWIREFERHGRAGDVAIVEEIAPYSYRVALQGRLHQITGKRN